MLLACFVKLPLPQKKILCAGQMPRMRRSKTFELASWLALFLPPSPVASLGQQQIISFEASSAAFQLAGGPVSKGQILVSSNDYWGVIRAAGNLALDFGLVTGTNYSLSNGVHGSAPASYVYHPVNNRNNTHVRSHQARVSVVHPLGGGQRPGIGSTDEKETAVHDNRHVVVLRAGVRGPCSSQRRAYCRHHWSLQRH